MGDEYIMTPKVQGMVYSVSPSSLAQALITSFPKVQTALSKVDVELSSAFHKSHQARQCFNALVCVRVWAQLHAAGHGS